MVCIADLLMRHIHSNDRIAGYSHGKEFTWRESLDYKLQMISRGILHKGRLLRKLFLYTDNVQLQKGVNENRSVGFS